MNKVLAMVSSALVVAGCATQVPQSLPSRMLPPSFTGTSPEGQQTWPDAAWFSGFGDARLTALVVKAQADNRDIAVAAARILEAQAQSHIQRAALLPQVGAQVNHLNDSCRGQSCTNFDTANAYTVSFNASYELDVWGLARDNLRAANETLKSAHFAQQSVALTVTANVVDQYLNVLALRDRIAIATEYIAAINSILDVIKLRVTAGADSHLDLAREQAQFEDVQAQLIRLETTEKQTLFSLAVLLGEPPEGFDVEAQNLQGILAPTVRAGLPSDLLLRRPDIAQAEANLASAHANLDAARAAFLPSISLTGQGGFISTTLSTLLRASNFGTSYGVNLLQTLFDGGTLVGRRRLADATQAQLVASSQSAVLNAYADVEAALVEVANSRLAEEHLQREIAAAREAFQISQLQYRQGVTDLLNVLQAQQTLFSAQDQLAQAALASRQASVHLFEALGGGWQESPADRTQFTPVSSTP